MTDPALLDTPVPQALAAKGLALFRRSRFGHTATWTHRPTLRQALFAAEVNARICENAAARDKAAHGRVAALRTAYSLDYAAQIRARTEKEIAEGRAWRAYERELRAASATA